MTSTINDEWLSFLQSQGKSSSFDLLGFHKTARLAVDPKMPKCDYSEEIEAISETVSEPTTEDADDELHVSTKTKVLHMNQPVDIQTVFWHIPIIDFALPTEGVVRKQIKVVSKTPEEYAELQEKLKNIPYYNEELIKQINNPNARRIKFKDERKITIGLSKKDIMHTKKKNKKKKANAFYNCFSMYLRVNYNSAYNEIHVKVFNTGKLEIPGVLDEGILTNVKALLLRELQPLVSVQLAFDDIEQSGNGEDGADATPQQEKNVLINSNFKCGFYINQNKLFQILRSKKYRIETEYDSDIYPAVKIRYYFNHKYDYDIAQQTGCIEQDDYVANVDDLCKSGKYTKINFMIFRTGSCLIVGGCSERILKFGYTFIKQLLADEYEHIHANYDEVVVKAKKPKTRKKTVMMTNDYYNSVLGVGGGVVTRPATVIVPLVSNGQ